jgi:hypothetical protein
VGYLLIFKTISQLFYTILLEVSRKGYIFANGNKQPYCQTLTPHAYGTPRLKMIDDLFQTGGGQK